MCAARILASDEPFTFDLQQNTSDLQPGDSVLIHAGRISSTATYHGFVRDITTNRIRVWIPLKNLTATVFEGQSWIIDKFPSDVTAEASHTALYDFLVAPRDEKKKAILETTPATFINASPYRARPSGATPPNLGADLQKLNPSPQQA